MQADVISSIDERIAARVRALRAQRGLSLEALAERSGVSRSMISLIERGESNATAVLLEKLATALSVPLAGLFECTEAAAHPVARAAERAAWRDPASGYERRNVSPAGFPSPIQIVEVRFPPGARVAYETAQRAPAVHQQIWVLEGAMQVSVGTQTHRLEAGDCLAHRLDAPVAYHNPTRRTSRYAVVIVVDAPLRG